MTSMRHCPVELLKLMAEQVSSPQTLRNLRAVDKTFYTLATPLAFQEMYLTNNRSSTAGVQALMDSRLASAVKRIVFRWSQQPETLADARVLRAIYSALTMVFSQLHRFSALTSLDLSFFPGSEPLYISIDGFPDLLHTPPGVGILHLEILRGLLQNDDLERVTSLTLDNLNPYHYSFYQTSQWTDLFSGLTQLRVALRGSSSLDGHRSEEIWAEMWQKIIPMNFLRPARAQLTSLTLMSDEHVGHFPPVNLSDVLFPSLKSLELGGLLFDQYRHVEDFIARHGHTLHVLVLGSCPMYVSEEFAVPPRSWRTVCDRFSGELEALVDLRVYTRTGHDAGNPDGIEEGSLVYASHTMGPRGLRKLGVPVALEKSDGPALERLLETVESRRRRQHAARCAYTSVARGFGSQTMAENLPTPIL